jgi:hypothetical protein
MAIICPKCKSQYDITLFEFGRTLKCDCGYVINPNKNQSEYKFVKVYSSPKQGEIALIKSLLDGNKIPYYIKGENFGTLCGPADGLSTMDIMIKEDYSEDAKKLLKDFINPSTLP